MPLTPKEPIVLNQTLNKFWAKQIVITADFVTQIAEAEVTLLPYNDSGEFSQDKQVRLVITDLLTRVTESPSGSVAQAYGALLAAIQEEYNTQNGI